MSHKIKTKNPDEVRQLFESFAEILDVYADDQIACKRYGTKRDQQHCDVRAKVYRGIATEIREMEYSYEC